MNTSKGALILIDLQKDFFSESPSISDTFPELPESVSYILRVARQQKLPVVHIRQVDLDLKNSPWYLHLPTHFSSFDCEVDNLLTCTTYLRAVLCIRRFKYMFFKYFRKIWTLIWLCAYIAMQRVVRVFWIARAEIILKNKRTPNKVSGLYFSRTFNMWGSF